MRFLIRNIKPMSWVVACVLLLAARSSVGQEFRGADPKANSSILREAYREPRFVGSYGPDGRFRTTRDSAADKDTFESRQPYYRRNLEEVPRWIDLRNRRDRDVTNLAPGLHARKTTHGRSFAAMLLESIVSAAYGHDVVLGTPTHLTTDSRGRVVLSDPHAPAIQVLDGATAFRIPGGPERRMQRPAGVAVDGDDNIYVADAGTGYVAVYDAQGVFLRYIGTYGDESMFEMPAGIAIDRTNRRLYVLDEAAGELVVFDLGGKIERRLGGPRRQGGMEFRHPSEIAVSNSRVVVLDSYGTRLQVFDLECRPLETIAIRSEALPSDAREMGLAVDAAGNIYISNDGSMGIKILRESGQVVGEFGGKGRKYNQFAGPSGVWVDTAGRIYVADTGNSRIQVFSQAAGDSAAVSGR